MCRRDGVERQTTSRFLNEAQFHSQVWVWDQPTAFGGAICRWWLCARATIGSILYVVVCSVRTLPFNSPSSFSITLPTAYQPAAELLPIDKNSNSNHDFILSPQEPTFGQHFFDTLTRRQMAYGNVLIGHAYQNN